MDILWQTRSRTPVWETMLPVWVKSKTMGETMERERWREGICVQVRGTILPGLQWCWVLRSLLRIVVWAIEKVRCVWDPTNRGWFWEGSNGEGVLIGSDSGTSLQRAWAVIPAVASLAKRDSKSDCCSYLLAVFARMALELLAPVPASVLTLLCEEASWEQACSTSSLCSSSPCKPLLPLDMVTSPAVLWQSATSRDTWGKINKEKYETDLSKGKGKEDN